MLYEAPSKLSREISEMPGVRILEEFESDRMTALQQILPNVWLLKPGYSAETDNTLHYEQLFVAALPSVSNEWNLCVEESVKFYGKTDDQTKRFNSWLMLMVMTMMIPTTR